MTDRVADSPIIHQYQRPPRFVKLLGLAILLGVGLGVLFGGLEIPYLVMAAVMVPLMLGMPLYYTVRARNRADEAVEAMRFGRNLAEWTIPPVPFARFLRRAHKDQLRRRTRNGVIAGAVIAAVAMFKSGSDIDQGFLLFLVCFLGIFPGGWIGWLVLANLIERRKTAGLAGEILVGANGVYRTGHFYTWKESGCELDDVELVPGDPMELRFTIRDSGLGVSRARGSVPVPAGMEGAADALREAALPPDRRKASSPGAFVHYAHPVVDASEVDHDEAVPPGAGQPGGPNRGAISGTVGGNAMQSSRGAVFFRCPSCENRDMWAYCGNCGKSTDFHLEEDAAVCHCEGRVSWVNCPECGTSVHRKFFYQDEAAQRRHAADLAAPPEEEGREGGWDWWAILGGIAFLVFVVTKGPDLIGCSEKSVQESHESHAIRAAKTLILKNLKAPKTAEFGDGQVLASQHPHYIVHLLVDAENSFGAKIRGSYCVAVELGEGDEFKYHQTNALDSKCSNPPDKNRLEILKAINNWPTSK